MRVKGYENYDLSEDGVVTNTRTGRILKYDITNVGYYRLTLCKEGKTKRFAVHRLVASHFHKNPEDKPVVNHIDGVKTNNHYSNLEWVTCSENTIHAFKTGLRVAPNKLPQETVDLIRQMRKDGKSRRKIAKELGFKESRISDVLYRYYKS